MRHGAVEINAVAFLEYVFLAAQENDELAFEHIPAFLAVVGEGILLVRAAAFQRDLCHIQQALRGSGTEQLVVAAITVEDDGAVIVFADDDLVVDVVFVEKIVDVRIQRLLTTDGITISRSIWLISPVLTSDNFESSAMLMFLFLRSSRKRLP